MIEAAKAELCGELNFAEPQEPLARNLDGRVSMGGYIDQHFEFTEGDRDPVAPLSAEEIKKRMKALQAENKRLKAAYPDNYDKAKKIRGQLEDYTRQLQRDIEAAQAGMQQYGHEGPPEVSRAAKLDQIEAGEPKHGKLSKNSNDFVKAYLKYQQAQYDSIVNSDALMPAAKGK